VQVYPELVIRDGDGNVMGVRYDMLSALLLNEMQKKDARVAALQRQTVEQQKQIVIQQKQIRDLQDETARIDNLGASMGALEEQARMARPERLAEAVET
jgi:hypothetical protein